MKNTLTSLALAGTLALGLTGCMKQQVYDWTEKDISESRAGIAIPLGNMPGNCMEQMFLVDLDNDGKADIVHNSKFVYIVADGYKDIARKNGYIMEEPVVIMTEKMRDSATQMLNANRDFTREYAKSKGFYSQVKDSEDKN